MKKLALVWSVLSLVSACGGNVVFDGEAGGGGGTTSNTTSGPTTTGPGTTTVGTGPAGCTSHDQCPEGACIFATGACASPCGVDYCDSCGPGSYCDGCATSSCPECLDCRAACLPVPPGRCDDDDPCPVGNVCIFGMQTCALPCDANGECGDPFTYCEPCITGSCCGCDNCVSVCIGGE
jgi:hypothetical protein